MARRLRRRVQDDAFTQHFLPVIDQMIENDTPFGEIEDYIEVSPLGDKQKGALWLIAWSALSAPMQRAIILDLDLIEAS